MGLGPTYLATATGGQSGSKREDGAHVGIRTRDLFLTKEVLYRLSYVGGILNLTGTLPPSLAAQSSNYVTIRLPAVRHDTGRLRTTSRRRRTI